MKILMIASLYRPYSRGGAEVVFNSIVDELKKSHDVSVASITPFKGVRSLIPRMTEEDGVRVYRFCPLNVFSFVNIMKQPMAVRLAWHVIDMFNIHSFFAIRSVINKEKPDIVMTHNLKGIGYTVPVAIRSCRVPHIHTVQDLQLIYPVGTLLFGEESARINTNFFVTVYTAACKMLFGSPTIIVFASDFLRHYYTKRSFFKRSKIVQLSNPIFLNKNPDEGNDSRKITRPFTFSFFGQLEKHKGILFLIDAFKKWKRDDVRLLIGSRGSLQAEVKRRIADDPRMEYMGFIEDLPIFLKSVHYAIMPSLCYENSPMITFENLAVGTPVIVSRIGGAAEPIRDGVNGFIFTPGDERSLIETLERAIDAVPDHYGELSKNARKSVLDYSVERYCEQLGEVSREASAAWRAR
ncbi:MAG: glycosyltransferase [Candidatus Uhrbacteria bacterium]|nr:glycosyltransferase [Candidatus Uhrbacteria bacterium]